ncbi:MAG: sialate O-acetylesterase [Clostridiales bacterium]|jgi:hypothetical protein|nr:sialate O-acetylesterase [Clostridiales bacterium]
MQNGMVMQRGKEDVCEIYLKSERPIQSASYASVGVDESRPVLVESADNHYRLAGIPVGGPYTVTVDDKVFTDIYVGDVWILGGQSNMEGIAWYEPEDVAFKGRGDVRALYMTDVWGPARHPLHELWKAVDKVHTEALGAGERAPHCGVGPGLRLFQDMARLYTVEAPEALAGKSCNYSDPISVTILKTRWKSCILNLATAS